MGFQTPVFKRPHCGQGMSEAVGPNWTLTPGGATYGDVVVLSCFNGNCQAALGAVFIPPRPRAVAAGQ